MNIFSTIWKNPRTAMREVLNSPSILIPLLVLYLGSVGLGLLALFDSQGMDFTSDLSTDLQAEAFEIPMWLMMIGAIIITPIFYLISNVIYSFFTMLFGKWLFKGTGTFKDLLKVNSMAYLPFALAIPVIGIWLIISPDSLLNTQYMGIVGLLVFILLALFTWVYFIIFSIVGVSEAHQFSKWKAFFTILIPMILFIIFIFLIVLALVLVLFFVFTSLAGV